MFVKFRGDIFRLRDLVLHVNGGSRPSPKLGVILVVLCTNNCCLWRLCAEVRQRTEGEMHTKFGDLRVMSSIMVLAGIE